MIFGLFSAFYGQRLVEEAWTNPSPWSILVQAVSVDAKLAIVFTYFF